MSACKGRKVYLRRDIRKYQEAWVFSAEDSDTFLGMAYTDGFKAPALATTDVEKAQLEDAITRKNKSRKLEKAYFESREEVSNQEKVALMEKYPSILNTERGYFPSEDKPKVVEMVTTPLDGVTRQIELEEEQIRENSNKIIPLREPKKEPKRAMFWADVLSDEEWEKKMGFSR
jgi:hypothetical protein